MSENTHPLYLARKAAGLTQEQVAKKIGAYAPRIGDYERGKYTPTVGTLYALAEALGGELQPLADALKPFAKRG